MWIVWKLAAFPFSDLWKSFYYLEGLVKGQIIYEKFSLSHTFSFLFSYIGSFIIGSSHRRCSLKKHVLKILAKFTGKYMCQTLCLAHVFFSEFCKVFKDTFLQNTSVRLLIHYVCFLWFQNHTEHS